jgi:hypothetical protein
MRCSGWSQARIAKLAASADTVHLEFIHDIKNVDRFIDKYSIEIAEFETKTKDSFAWRATLKVGDQIDSHDKTVWNRSTILDMK